MKKLLSLLLAVAMLLSLTSLAFAEDEITITVFHYMAQDAKQAGLDAIEASYSELHPNVKFKNVYYNQGTDYFPQLSTALSSGEQPNVIMGNPGLYPDLVEEGYVMDLTDNEMIKAMNLPAGDLGDVSANGRIYGFPIDFKTWGIFYNTKIFADNGLEVPTTLTQLNELQDKLTALKIDPYVHSFNDAVYGDIEWRNTFWTRALAAGDNDIFERLMSGDAKWVDLPYAAEALNNIALRVKNARPDAMSNTQDMALEVFCSGGAAMRYDGSWNIGSMLNKKPEFEIGYFLVPIDDAGSAKLNVQVDQSFMVNPQADHADVALDFMEFWLSQGVAWSEISQMPLNTGVVSDKLLPMVRTLAEIKKSGDIAHYGNFTKPFTSAYTTALRTELTSYVESCITGGGMTVEQALANLDNAFADVRALN
ncbi:MAG: extracellular solute-binding protein [Clostridia bacterium]|jgi:raffinose/stachyose/melibiose transport system substrate-binding protein|nr:extracellular solute-binding protein [Clostridia bacterium]